MATNIFWHGHANFQITSGDISILVDPFFSGNPVCTTSWNALPKPKLVLITHDHGDHVGDAIQICRTTGALCCGIYDTVMALVSRGLPEQLVGAALNLGGSSELFAVRITMTPAMHTSETGAPAGFIVRLPSGFTIYHAGDTALFGDMALIGQYHAIDLALLPIGDVYTMTAEQAAHACALLRPRMAIPMHWGTFPPLAQNPDSFAAALELRHPSTRAVLMRPGETVTL